MKASLHCEAGQWILQSSSCIYIGNYLKPRWTRGVAGVDTDRTGTRVGVIFLGIFRHSGDEIIKRMVLEQAFI